MKRHNLPDSAMARSRTLRRNATGVEKQLWTALRTSLPQHKFRRQVPMGAYIADFVCHAARLIIEMDGGQHARSGHYDATRTLFLNGEGYRVMRFLE